MSKKFWNKEYDRPAHLTMSDEPAGDVVTFSHWAERNSEWYPFPRGGMVLDLGCGNGRNLLYMCKEYSMQGYGVDISDVAISQAKKVASEDKLQIELKAASITDKLPQADESVDVVLDMMTSHILNTKQREIYINEVVRVLKPFGWLFMKTFVMDGDMHAKRLIAERPGDEPQTYVHPKIGEQEYVWTEHDLEEWLGKHFKVHKMLKSYKHVTRDGKPYKRRTIAVYAEKLRQE